MKLFAPLIVVLLAVAFLGGCGVASNNVRPFDALDLTVTTDTTAANAAAVAVQDGVPPAPYINDLYTAKALFQTTLPFLESTAAGTAAATLDPSAVTKTKLDSDIATMNQAVLNLHLAITNSLTASIEGQHKAVMAAKKK